jgi:hypothetical protein
VPASGLCKQEQHGTRPTLSTLQQSFLSGDDSCPAASRSAVHLAEGVCPMLSTTSSTASVWSIHPPLAVRLRSKFRRLVSSPLRWYRQSMLRIVVLEIQSFPLRIVAAINTPPLRLGRTLFDLRKDCSMGNFDEENRYERICSASIRELQGNHPWVGPLDLEIATQMHRQGALWAFDSPEHLSCHGNETHSTEQVQPYKRPLGIAQL